MQKQDKRFHILKVSNLGIFLFSELAGLHLQWLILQTLKIGRVCSFTIPPPFRFQPKQSYSNSTIAGSSSDIEFSLIATTGYLDGKQDLYVL